MLFDIFIRIFTAPIRGLLMLLPTLNIEIPPDAFMAINGYIKLACFFLPMQAVVLVLSIKFLLFTFRLIMATIKSILSFIPTMGG